MANNPKRSNTAANAACDAMAALANSGRLKIYDGSQPATADTAVGAQVVLADLTMNATAFGSAVAGVATANAITSDTSADTVVRTITSGTALPATTGIAANWFPYGPSVGKPGVAGTPGYGLWAQVDGRIIVPPGRYFATQVIANVVGETFISQIAWHESQLNLG